MPGKSKPEAKKPMMTGLAKPLPAKAAPKATAMRGQGKRK